MSRMRVLVGTRKGAFILASDGSRKRWNISGPYFGGWEVYHMKGSPADPDRLYASQSNAWFGQVIQRSSDGGKTWEAPAGSIPGEPGSLRRGPSPTFVYETTPGAGAPLSTHQWYDGTQHPWEFVRVWHLEPSGDDPETVYAGVEDAALFRSTDGGRTWQDLLSGLRGHSSGPSWAPGAGGLCLHTILLDPIDPGRMFVAISAAGTFRTDGGGRTWRPVNRGLHSAYIPDPSAEVGHCVHRIAMHRSRPGVLFMQKHWDVMRSDDAGESWYEISGNLPTDFGFVIDVHAHDPDTVYVVPITSDSEHFPPEGKLRVYGRAAAAAGGGGGGAPAHRGGDRGRLAPLHRAVTGGRSFRTSIPLRYAGRLPSPHRPPARHSAPPHAETGIPHCVYRLRSSTSADHRKGRPRSKPEEDLGGTRTRRREAMIREGFHTVPFDPQRGEEEGMTYDAAYALLDRRLRDRGVDVEAVRASLRSQRLETPSWVYGNSGTRFAVFPWPGAARTIWEKLEDAALVHRLTGICPTVALHIPWDQVDDYSQLRARAAELGLAIGAVNPNLFQDDDYRLGSLCHPDPRIRRKATDHILHCIQVAQAAGSACLSLWLADGTNYPGQDALRDRKRRLAESLAEVASVLPAGMRLLLEYKFFEPAFYHTDLPDWGLAFLLAVRLGPQAQVLVDTGHHPQGTNIEHIVAVLLDEGRLGGFHFNSRKYADDDLIVGALNPHELFLIFWELVFASHDPDPVVAGCARTVHLMLDQSHTIEGKIEAVLVSVDNVQTAYAKALLVDRAALAERQRAGDVLGAHRVLQEAYATDVRPLLASVREEMGVPPDPVAAFRAGGYAERLARERSTASEDPGTPQA